VKNKSEMYEYIIEVKSK